MSRSRPADCGKALKPNKSASTSSFNDGWAEYADRQNYLLEATLGVTVHFAGAGTHFAFRARDPDYLWAGAPTVSTEGEAFAELIGRDGLGLKVPAQG